MLLRSDATHAARTRSLAAHAYHSKLVSGFITCFPCPPLLQAVTEAQFATVTSASTLSLPTSSDSSSALTGAAQALGADLGGSESPSAMRTLLSTDSPATTDSANPVVTAGSVLDSWLAATGSITYQVSCLCVWLDSWCGSW